MLRAGVTQVGWIACALVACGRLGFDDHDPPPSDAPSDAPAMEGGVPCATDADCGPCQRCDNQQCGDEPFDELILGHRTTCFLGSGGSRWCVGEDPGLGSGTPSYYPQRIVGDDGWSSLSLGYQANFGVKDAGLWQWSTTEVPTAFSAQVPASVSVAIEDYCFLDAAGSASCDDQPVAGTWTSVHAGYEAFCGIQPDHSLWCWGTDEGHVLGQGSASADGTVYNTPVEVGTDVDWMQVSIGDRLACGRKLDDSLWCWGDPYDTGTSEADTMGVPTQISALTDWMWMDVQWQHACAGEPSGTVWCWGFDDYGLDVLPGAAQVAVPTKMSQTWDQLLMGGHHYCGLTGGLWYCWGWNASGQLGIGNATTTTMPSAPFCTPG